MKQKFAFLLILACALPLHAAWHVARHIAIGGEGGWDYINADAAARRLYVSHSDAVVVIDLNDHKVVGTIPAQGVHGIVTDDAMHRGFISNGRSSTVTIFDTQTLKPTAEVKATGDNPDSILWDPATKHLFTFNGRGHNATAYDADGKVLATIALDAKPEEARSDLAGHIFVNYEDKSEIAVLDANKFTVEKVWPIAPCEEPSGLAIDRAHHRLFAGCGNQKMVAVDSESGK
ncbi:MAG TPA: YncE family protein, partial [Thermoanaerobaculia bacterium]|nr:YncE family protein [Thermoanaerobaculia bacterium]